MKSAGLAMIAAVIALTGIYISDRKKRQAQQLFVIAQLFSQLKGLCESGQYTALQAFYELSGRREFSSLTFLNAFAEDCAEGMNLRALWESAVRESEVLYFDLSARTALSQFGNALGRRTREEFSLCCTKLYEEFSEKAQYLGKSWEKTREATVLSGVLIAAAVFFIFM